MIHFDVAKMIHFEIAKMIHYDHIARMFNPFAAFPSFIYSFFKIFFIVYLKMRKTK